MDELLNRLHTMVGTNDIDINNICREFSTNPYRRQLNDILIERKDILRGKINMGILMETEGQSPEIENILMQLSNPTFPLLEGTEEKDDEWANIEKKYFDGIEKITNDLRMKEMILEQDKKKGLEQIQIVLRRQMNYRPIDERDMNNARESVAKRFEQAKIALRDECATKILVLRREVEQQGRKRRNFDKKTTDILQNWFNEHRDSPYPSDEEKLEMAKQCGIKVAQVNNWFGNQRIRNKMQTQKIKVEEFQIMAETHHSIPQHDMTYPIEFQQPQHNYLPPSTSMHPPPQQQAPMQNDQMYYRGYNSFNLSPLQGEMNEFNETNMNYLNN